MDEVNMTPVEIYRDLIEKICKDYGLKSECLHDYVFKVYLDSVDKFEIARFVFDEGKSLTGVCFFITVIPSDAITIFNKAKTYYPELVLFDNYYENSYGDTYTGTDAQIMHEQALEEKYMNLFKTQLEVQEEQDMILNDLDKKGNKITFH